MAGRPSLAGLREGGGPLSGGAGVLPRAAARGEAERSAGVLLYVVAPEAYFLSHRLPLARAARAAGWEVHVATPPPEGGGGGGEWAAREGMTSHRVALHRSIGTPAQELAGVRSLARVCRQVRPDLVHAVAPKAAVCAGLVSRMMGIPAVLAKGGLGTTVLEGGFVNSAARRLIRWAILASVTPRTTLVVQNPDEWDDLARSRRVRSRTVIVEGAGVDCAAFAPRPEPPGPVAVLLPARLLRSKGVLDFVEAARRLRARGVRARFLLAGDADPGNVSTVDRRELRAWTDEGTVEWLGHRHDMPALVAGSHVVCLPSHGEGLPKALTEAAASGRAIVATDVPGCREVVEHGRNGLLVPARDPAALAGALERLIREPETRARMGAAGRAIALERFDERIIIPRMLGIYRSLVTAEA